MGCRKERPVPTFLTSWMLSSVAQRSFAEPQDGSTLREEGVGAGVLPFTLALVWRRGGSYQLAVWMDLWVGVVRASEVWLSSSEGFSFTRGQTRVQGRR